MKKCSCYIFEGYITSTRPRGRHNAAPADIDSVSADDPDGSCCGAHIYPSPNAALTRTQAAANLCIPKALPPIGLPLAHFLSAFPLLPNLHHSPPSPLNHPRKA